MTVIQLAGAGGGDVYILDVYLTASAGSPDLTRISVTATKGTSSFSAISDASEEHMFRSPSPGHTQ